ncbi:hypothetical protein [Acinetobacter sp.]|uniref:hypothetical protein n=1 Tax=Acinetobacter sp. TaxID=472 RepID=UPI003CFD0B3A
MTTAKELANKLQSLKEWPIGTDKSIILAAAAAKALGINEQQFIIDNPEMHAHLLLLKDPVYDIATAANILTASAYLQELQGMLVQGEYSIPVPENVLPFEYLHGQRGNPPASIRQH